MAASWDPALVEKSQAIAALEASASGIHWAFSPMVDVTRDPRWGRMVEGAGEDPYLGAAMARAQVRGLQGPSPGSPDHLLAGVKHFAGYGASEGGRDHDAANLSLAQLHNVIFPPFRAAIDAGAAALMTAYMDLNDVPATGNRWLLRDVLRKEWGFDGFVVSDNNAVNDLVSHGFARDGVDAAARGIEAGVNLSMSMFASVYMQLPEAVRSGRITVQQIDAAVRPLLAMKYQIGLFEHPYADPKKMQAVAAKKPEHLAAARVAAERSAVLLRNENALLPLRKSAYKRIAVIGPLADSKQDIRGPWVAGKDNGEAITVLDGLRREWGTGAQIDYAPGAQLQRWLPSVMEPFFRERNPEPWTPAQTQQARDDAVKLGANADLIVLVLGESQAMSGEAASVSTLALAGEQQQLLEAVAALGKPTVLVLINGRPLNIVWASEHVPAILEAWFPGAEGGSAIANLLVGDAVPGGKLPFTWPRNEGQIPLYYAHNKTQSAHEQGRRYWNEPSTPLYPFGYGLGYTTFEFSDIRVSAASIRPGASIDVSAVVQNTGKVAADEVAQLYIHQRSGSASRPVRELKGFQRVTLQPGEKRTLHFTLGKDELAYWSTATQRWVNEAAAFDVWVGADSTTPLHASFDVAP
jgi:beta-glucosidase